jgi:hypothetical protein
MFHSPVWIADGHHDEEIARFVFEVDGFVSDIVTGARDELQILTLGADPHPGPG